MKELKRMELFLLVIAVVILIPIVEKVVEGYKNPVPLKPHKLPWSSMFNGKAYSRGKGKIALKKLFGVYKR